MDPIINEETEILIVGTYPSEISRAISQYYGNPRNQFWKLMSGILGIDMQEMDYNNRIETLLKHKIGLWDTLKACKITGSSDSSIRNQEYNDLSHLTHIRKIICNGKKAEDFIKHCNVSDGVEIVRVASSSPARAMVFGEKMGEWKGVLN
ncbi:DNA-deoxyinosine glycosylase [Methanolobus sp. ZRKC3]|uniref:DNA-deoxyinosine glycosylase n=1 Tax=Methanolobus sp. ZRKC3 TaxID=3125786 RepID=UPI003248C66E